MSIEAQEKVYALPISDPHAIAVLGYLAFRMNRGNGDCFVSRDRIAKDLRLSGEFVRQKLRWLEGNQFLKTERGGGRRNTNSYQLLDGKGATLLPLSSKEKGQRQQPKGATPRGKKGQQLVAPNVREPKEHGARAAQPSRPDAAQRALVLPPENDAPAADCAPLGDERQGAGRRTAEAPVVRQLGALPVSPQAVGALERPPSVIDITRARISAQRKAENEARVAAMRAASQREDES